MANCNNCDCGITTLKMCKNTKINFCLELLTSISMIGFLYYKNYQLKYKSERLF